MLIHYLLPMKKKIIHIKREPCMTMFSQQLSTITAIPWPPPMQAEPMASFPFVRLQ